MLEDRVALVTGGARGIGLAIASTFAAHGAAVVIADIDEVEAAEAAARLVDGGNDVVAIACDVASVAAVDDVFAQTRDRLGAVDILVNNALRTTADSLEAMTIEAWKEEFDVTLHGAAICIKAALPDMIDRGRGVILNIASVNGEAFFGLDGYSAAKAALIALTRSVAVRYGPNGIRCNAIAPGAIRSAQWDKRIAANPQVLEREQRWYPLGRLGRPADVAEAALFLSSDAAGWITGITLRVDGGLMAGNAINAAEVEGRVDPADPSA